MTGAAWAWVGVAAAFAVADWIAVATQHKPMEYVCKPATMAALIGAGIALQPVSPAQRAWFVAALVLSLLGDVFLMLPSDRFIAGLAAFLVAHLCYVGGFVAHGLPRLDDGALLVPVIVVLVQAIRVLRRMRDHPRLRLPVTLYIAVIGAMYLSGLASGSLVAALGASAFVCSDALIAEHRFVAPRAWQPLAIIVLYHLGQALLVISLTQGVV